MTHLFVLVEGDTYLELLRPILSKPKGNPSLNLKEHLTPVIAHLGAMRRVKATRAKVSSHILRLVKGVTIDDLILVLCPRGNAILIRRLAVCMLIGDF